MKQQHMARFFPFVLVVAVAALTYAQAPPRAPATLKSPKDAAPFDITGYWVSIVTEDWRTRMFTPLKGDFSGIPISVEGRKVAEAWDPVRDEAEENQCKSYGAAAIMRVPGRFHIVWENENTLKIETDSGMQTRFLHFSGTLPQRPNPQLQGYSTAAWERQLGSSGGDGRGPGPSGSLKVVTVNLKPGYLRKNGVPYSDKTVVTEFYDLVHEPDSEWLIVKTIVDDPVYLQRPFITSTNLRRQIDSSGWNPTKCAAK
jgi:hypothetical protein